MAAGRAATPLLVGGPLGLRKKMGVGNSSAVHSRRAAIGHRGSLLPRRFDTSESRGVRADLTAGVGRRAPGSVRRPARTIDCRAPLLTRGHSAYCSFRQNKRVESAVLFFSL